MPQLAQPDLPAELEAVIRGFGISRAAVAVLLSLADGQSANFSTITQRVDLSPTTVSAHLAQLEQAGFVHGSIPKELRKGRRPVTWSIDHAAISVALEHLHATFTTPPMSQ